MAERIWTSRDQAIFHEAIGRELLARLAHEGQAIETLSQNYLGNRRYAIHLDFYYGASAAETRAKRALLFASLDAGRVPTLTVNAAPLPTPELQPAA